MIRNEPQLTETTLYNDIYLIRNDYDNISTEKHDMKD